MAREERQIICMKRHEDVEQKIEQAMRSLDGLSKAAAGPFFYTRLSARLENQENSFWLRLSGFIARPVVMASLVLAVITGNYLVFYQKSHTPVVASYTDVSQDEYSLQSITYYEPETP